MELERDLDMGEIHGMDFIKVDCMKEYTPVPLTLEEIDALERSADWKPTMRAVFRAAREWVGEFVRLRAYQGVLETKCDDLCIENAKLREALEKIANVVTPNWASTIARVALQKDEG